MKARYRPYNPGEGYFTLIDPEDIKRHNPLLKAIDSFVEEHISVEPFSQSIKRLTCPGGQVMETLIAREDRGNFFYRFRPDARVCQDCSLRYRCYRGKSKYRDFRVKKEYFETLSLRARMTEKLSSEHGKKRMRGRSCLIEHVFGEIKDIFRFRRFLHRSLEKVRLIWQLVCIGYNLRKMARLAYG